MYIQNFIHDIVSVETFFSMQMILTTHWSLNQWDTFFSLTILQRPTVSINTKFSTFTWFRASFKVNLWIIEVICVVFLWYQCTICMSHSCLWEGATTIAWFWEGNCDFLWLSYLLTSSNVDFLALRKELFSTGRKKKQLTWTRGECRKIECVWD